MLLFHFLATVVSSYSQLEGLQFQSGKAIELVLSTLIVDNNLTFALSGNYTTLEGTAIQGLPAPSLHQRLTSHTTMTKPHPSLSNAQIGFVPDPNNDAVFFNAAGTFMYAWDLQAMRYLFSFAASAEIVAIYAFSESASTTVLVLSYKKQQLIFELASFMLDLGFLPDEEFKIYFPMASLPLGTYIEKRKSHFYAYIWRLDSQETGVLTAYMISLTKANAVIQVNSLSAASLSLPSFIPVGFATLFNAGFLCDKEFGVLLLDVDRWVKSTGPPVVYSKFIDPRYYGQLLGCSLVEDYLYVTTETSLLVYVIEELKLGEGDQIIDQTLLICEFASYEGSKIPSISSSTGLMISPALGIIASMLQYTNSSDISLRVLNNNDQYKGYGYITLEEPLCSLGLDTCAFPLAFTMLPFKSNQARIVIDSLAAMHVFTLWIYAELVLEANITYTYRYIGEIKVDKAGVELTKVPFSLIAWDSTGSSLYSSRNSTTDSGFLAPTDVIHKLNSMDGLATVIYLPLSNYYSGHLVEYNVSLLPGAPSNLNLSYPAPVSLNSTYLFPSTQAFPFLTTLQFAEFTLIAALNKNQIVLFDASATAPLAPLSTLIPSQPQYNITQCTAVIQLFSSVAWVVVESELLLEHGYAYIWDIYSISNPKVPILAASVAMQSLHKYGKLQGSDNTLFSLRTNGIFVGKIQENDGNTVFLSLHSVTAISAQLPSLHPIDFTVDFGDKALYVYDKFYGLIQFLPNNEGEYVGNVSGIPLSANPNAVHLCLHDSRLMLLDPASHSNAVVDYSADYQITGKFPLLPNMTYISATIAFNLLALFTTTSQGQGLLLFDREAETFRGLIAFLPISEAYAVVSVEGDIYHAFGYDGETLTRWNIGQVENEWMPSSEWVPVTCLERTVWAKLTFSFATLINEPEYQAAVAIQATSQLSGDTNSTVVNVLLVNTGSYIRLAEGSTSPSPLLTGQLVSLGNDTLEMPVPGNFFLGSDLTFAFLLNENIGLPLKPQISCDPANSLVCISTKQYPCTACLSAPDTMQTVLAFLMTPNYAYFASSNEVIKHSLAADSANLTFAIKEMRGADLVVCYLLSEVKGNEDLVVVAGIEVTDSYSGQFLMLLNTTDAEKSMYFELSTMLLTVEAAVEDGEIRIFASDISRIFVLITSNDTLLLSSIISDVSLRLNSFYPTSINYLNSHFILVADSYTGLFVLQRSNVTEQYFIYQALEGFKGFNESGVAAIALSPDSLSLYVLSQSTALSHFSLYTTDLQVHLALLDTIAPIAEDLETYLVNDVLAIDVTGRFAAFPFYDGTYCRVRVVDLEAAAILTSTDSVQKGYPDYMYRYGNVAILSSGQETFSVIVELAFSFQMAVFTSFIIRPASTAYVFPQENTDSSNKLISLQLEAFNSLSKAVALPFKVIFTA